LLRIQRRSDISFQLPPNHHLDYTDSYTTGAKEIADTKIAMHETLIIIKSPTKGIKAT
jgi:hypothetical protein